MLAFNINFQVFLKRQHGSVDFNGLWEQYENGFGNADGEYWLGM